MALIGVKLSLNIKKPIATAIRAYIYSFHHEIKTVPPWSKNRSTTVERFLLHGGTNTCSLSGS
ncbi:MULTISPECIES: hypothetical protein [Bacteroides]|uniref:Uncharacterized protein n=2 Tax=Bacteroides TaxID=816 RepID=A0A9X2SSP9_9BACE|nr:MULTISPECIES: hypothetical protein [Bacteroides]MCR6505036.1 hypothetical protein [Bacteroides muris (ex Fokt et al. 2023)]